MRDSPPNALFAAREVTFRRPFEVTALPLLARLHRAGYRPRRRAAKRLIGRPAARLYRTLRTGGLLPGVGSFTVGADAARRTLPLDARNTQFGALYMPQHGVGYEPEVAALIDLLAGTDGTFVDVGANWGYFPFYLLSREDYRGDVHAVEAHPDSFANLAAAVAASAWAGRVTCHHVALSDRAGEGTLALVDGVQSGLARLTEEPSSGMGVGVTTARLDELELGDPALVKLDVEGHEAQVLAGAETLLGRGRAIWIVESWLERQAPETTLAPLRLLARRGHHLFQPVWLVDHPGGPFAVDGRGEPPGASAVLGLVRFLPEQRFLLGGQINLVACPEGRLGDLRAAFSG